MRIHVAVAVVMALAGCAGGVRIDAAGPSAQDAIAVSQGVAQRWDPEAQLVWLAGTERAGEPGYGDGRAAMWSVVWGVSGQWFNVTVDERGGAVGRLQPPAWEVVPGALPQHDSTALAGTVGDLAGTRPYLDSATSSIQWWLARSGSDWQWTALLSDGNVFRMVVADDGGRVVFDFDVADVADAALPAQYGTIHAVVGAPASYKVALDAPRGALAWRVEASGLGPVEVEWRGPDGTRTQAVLVPAGGVGNVTAVMRPALPGDHHVALVAATPHLVRIDWCTSGTAPESVLQDACGRAWQTAQG